jgi:hypothetical protein
MPYKHIAAHLKKTELACRLHYHQLSFGNKRHRHHTSSSSLAPMERSSSSPSSRGGDEMQRPLPAFSPPSNTDRFYRPVHQTSTSPQNHVPILPKPVPSFQRVSRQTKTLRLITDDMGRFEEKPVIDMARLNRIYNAHRIHFWSMIAQSYGSDVSASTLEDCWRSEQAHLRADLPPTPCGSPQSAKLTSSILNGPSSSGAESGKGFTPINTPQTSNSAPSAVGRGSFAISSLLTEDKEVRSPPHENRL